MPTTAVSFGLKPTVHAIPAGACFVDKMEFGAVCGFEFFISGALTCEMEGTTTSLSWASLRGKGYCHAQSLIAHLVPLACCLDILRLFRVE